MHRRTELAKISMSKVELLVTELTYIKMQEANYLPYFRYYKTHLYLFFSILAVIYNRNLEDFYLINKYFRGDLYSRASSIQNRLIIAKITYLKLTLLK